MFPGEISCSLPPAALSCRCVLDQGLILTSQGALHVHNLHLQLAHALHFPNARAWGMDGNGRDLSYIWVSIYSICSMVTDVVWSISEVDIFSTELC